jgi:cytochrome c-type biogenesis protein CcmH/NrfG
MSGPLFRLAAAVVLLAAYHRWLIAAAVPAHAAAAVSPAILRDIDASQSAFSAGRYRDALPPTERLTVALPSQAIYFDRLARIRHELGDARQEALAWEGVFRTSPTPADACPMLAQAYDAARDSARTLDAYERCVQVDPDNPDALLYLGRAYNAAERAADARRMLERALTVAPLYPDIHLLLGVREFADGHIAEARSRFERFLELSPGRRDEVAVWLERTGAGRP